MFHTPKRTLQRPTKKGHKTNQQDEDAKGVGLIRGEVTPESRSANDDPSLMRANAATRHERSGRSGPHADPKHKSSDPESQAYLLLLKINMWHSAYDDLCPPLFSPALPLFPQCCCLQVLRVLDPP